MIFDLIKNMASYHYIASRMESVIDYIENTDLSTLHGKTLISGENIFVLTQHAQLKEVSAARWEVHRKYLDIHIPLSEKEWIQYAPAETLTRFGLYSPQTDIQFSDDTRDGMMMAMHVGCFAMFLPQDAHMPCLGAGSVDKLVIKVLLDSASLDG